MIFEKIKSEVLSHNSYFIASGLEACVIDPKRDIDIYLELAEKNNVRIKYIFETHRNEDYVIGSLELSNITDAKIYHGSKLDFKYGNPVKEKDKFKVGFIELEILETPGHTDESISIILRDTEATEDIHMVFTGDTLFAGDIGRTDLYELDQRSRLAESIHDSIFNKIMQLNDGVIVCPAHGSGSVCGGSIKNLEYTTIGFERRNNPWLKIKDKQDFITKKTMEEIDRPPYFEKMEVYNNNGPPLLKTLPKPNILNVKEFKDHIKSGSQLIDTRGPIEFAGGHIPGSLNIWLDVIPLIAGWLLKYEKPIIIIKDNSQSLEKIVRYFIRLGFDNIKGYLAKDISTWFKAGEIIERIDLITINQLKSKIEKQPPFILDVRKKVDTVKDGFIEGSTNIFIGDLENKIKQIPKDKEVVVHCYSGYFGSSATSILKKKGYNNIYNMIGGINAWKNANYPIKQKN
jgi:hydroxyacylglutathione hydrolase